MGIDFTAGRTTIDCVGCGSEHSRDYCSSICGEFYSGKSMFKQSPDKFWIEDGQFKHDYKGADGLFAKHIDDGEYHLGQDAINRWQAVKACIKDEDWETVRAVLEDGDGWIYAGW